MDQISNPRLRNLKEKTLRYHFRMVHIPGAKNRASDAISRHPTGNLIPLKMQLSDDVFHISHFTLSPELKIPLQLIAGIHLEDQQLCDDMENSLMHSMAAQLQDIHTVNWNQVCTTTSSDTDMLLLLSTIKEGMPDHRSQLLPQLGDYHQFREHLYSIDGVIIYKSRIVILPSLRQHCLSALHAAHKGISSMISRAKTSIFWPGITTDIHTTTANCSFCNQMAPSQAALSPTPPILAAYPFQCI